MQTRFFALMPQSPRFGTATLRGLAVYPVASLLAVLQTRNSKNQTRFSPLQT
jgi:hypothetical protein